MLPLMFTDFIDGFTSVITVEEALNIAENTLKDSVDFGETTYFYSIYSVSMMN